VDPGDSETGLDWQERDWAKALSGVLKDPEQVGVQFQPIVDLRRGSVWGYETLARFPGGSETSSDRWFEAAERLGVSADLQAILLSRSLESRRMLPDGRFLMVNVRPEDLGTDYVQNVIARGGDLDSVVFEITDLTTLLNSDIKMALGPVRKRGARVALDDVGSSYTGLSRMNRLRPDFLKLDQHLVAGAGQDPDRLELIEALHVLAKRIDSTVVVEGIQSVVELNSVIGLDIPLAQGFGLGRPSDTVDELDPEIASHIRDNQNFRMQHESFAEMVVPVEPHHDTEGVERLIGRFKVDPDLNHVVVVNADEHPVTIVGRDAEGLPTEVTKPLCVGAGSSFARIAREAMTRPEEHQFDPLVFRDEIGRYVGLIPMENLIEALADTSTA
jgi:EAL domain-containing protein (putative c-di-GMP-specific phosphodiesterase class I)